MVGGTYNDEAIRQDWRNPICQKGIRDFMDLEVLKIASQLEEVKICRLVEETEGQDPQDQKF